MAKQTKPAAAKKKSMTWLIAALVVIVVIVIVLWSKQGAQPVPKAAAPAPEAAPAPAPEAAPAPATGTAEEGAPSEAVGEAAAPPVELGTPGSAKILKQGIAWIPSGGQPQTNEEGVSEFSDVTCKFAKDDKVDVTGASVDAITFTIVNKGTQSYHLFYAKYGTEEFNNAMRINVNGRRLTDVEKACGKMDIAAGETLTCTDGGVMLRSGKTYTGAEKVNFLQAQTNQFVDEVVFTCGGEEASQ